MSLTVLTDYLGRTLRLTTERRQHILQHPAMVEWVDKMSVRRQRRGEKTLRKPLKPGCRIPMLDVCFVSSASVERYARAGGHPVPGALVPWIPAKAGMTRGCRNWQCMYEMDT